MPESLSLPLAITAAGPLAALATDSPAEIAQSVAVLLSTRVGERRSESAYGSAGQLFALVPTLAVDSAAINRWEPRATPETIAVTIEGSP